MVSHLKHLHLRLERAKKHLDNFKRQEARFIHSNPYEMVTEEDTDGVNQLLRIKAKSGKEPPPELGFLAGDCIHNLRAILDNLIWKLGNLSGCSKTKLGELTFPVCKVSTAFDDWTRKFNCLPQSTIGLIGSLQPYQPYKGRNDPSMHPLWVLNRLWNEDKHRSPVLIVTLHRSTQITPVAQSVQFIVWTNSEQASIPPHNVYLGDRL